MRIKIWLFVTLLVWNLPLLAQTEAAREAMPWTHLNFPIDAEKFTFAIIADRTGSQMPGIFQKAVKEINLLAPDFVLCVGDLVEGYTEDESVLKKQWDEFVSIVSTFKMPFFYLPGNHDISNEMMRKVYRERFGREYYSFDYKGYHFVILNTEDPPGSDGRIGEEQLAWLQNDLANSTEAKYTFLFLHQPLWAYKDAETRNWLRVEELFSNRKYMVFAGHIHQYVKYLRHDRRYFILATTGGVSELREPLGEFHHYALVTMENREPQIALVKVGSIMDENVVLAEDVELLTALYDGGYIIPPKIITNSEKMFASLTDAFGLRSGTYEVAMRVKNDSHNPLTFEALWTFDIKKYSVTPETFRVQLSPGEASPLKASVTFLQEQTADNMELPVFKGVWKFTNSAGNPIEVPLEIPLQCGRLLACEKLTFTPKIDGHLTEWENMPIKMEEGKNIYFYPTHWKGNQDCSAQAVVGYDSENLYIAARVRDEAIITSDTDAVWEKDSLEVYLDMRTPEEQTILLSEGTLQIIVAPKVQGKEQRLFVQTNMSSISLPEGTLIVSQADETGYIVEAKFPFVAIKTLSSKVKTLSGKEGETFRFSFGVNDLDPDEVGRLQMMWMGTQDNYRRTDGYADFVLEK